MGREQVTRTNPNGVVSYCEDYDLHLGHEYKPNEESFFTVWCPGFKAEVVGGLGSIGVAIDVVKNTAREACAKQLSELTGINFMSWDDVVNMAPTLGVKTPELEDREAELQKAREDAVNNYATSLGHSLMSLPDWAPVIAKAARAPKVPGT